MEASVSVDRVINILQAKAQHDPTLRAQLESAMWQAAAEQAMEESKKAQEHMNEMRREVIADSEDEGA